MDDDGSKSLDFTEFKKGLNDYGLAVTEEVMALLHACCLSPIPLPPSVVLVVIEMCASLEECVNEN